MYIRRRVSAYCRVGISGPNQTVTAESMENIGGRIVFSNGATVVRSFASDEVVGVEGKS